MIVTSEDKMQCFRILLAEDYKMNRKMTVLILKRLGYEVDTVTNGLEVLEAFESQRYRLELMNLCMPEMNGLEATREIRKRLSEEDQPFIVTITAYALEDIKERCYTAGMDECLIRPVSKEELAASLKKYIPSIKSL